MSRNDVRTALAYLKVSLFLAASGVLVLYTLPSLVELAVLPYFGPIVAAFALGDVLGCLILWFLGFSRRAILCYGLATVSKVVLLSLGAIQPRAIVWFCDIVPSLTWIVMSFVCTAELSQAIMSSLERSLDY